MVEIRVEEGYATRQMDEYFRQTIAAIKEELTKKLETKKEKNAAARARNANSKPSRQPRQAFIYDSNSEDDVSDADNEELADDYDADKFSIRTRECACISCCCEVYTEKQQDPVDTTRSSGEARPMSRFYEHFLASTRYIINFFGHKCKDIYL